MNGLLSILAMLLAGYVLLAAGVYFRQAGLLYLPDMPGRTYQSTPDAAGLDYRSVTLHTSDGETLDAWFVPSRNARATVLFCHGNAGNISHRLESIRLLHELGLSVLIFDYRGYGRSSGRPSEQGTYRDADSAWAWLVDERGVEPDRILLFGRSLGAAVVADLATRQQPAGVILESGFTSVPDVAARHFPWLPVRWLSRYRYNTLDKLAHIRSPLLVVHSRDDEIIPVVHGERLFAAAREPKRFVELRGSHNDGFRVSGDGYVQALGAFIASVTRTGELRQQGKTGNRAAGRMDRRTGGA